MNEYFGNNAYIPNNGTCFRRNIFSSPGHRRPFKLKSHYNHTACNGEKIPHSEIFISSLSQRSLRRFSILVVLTFCPRGGVTSCYCLLHVHAIARRFLHVRCGLVVPCGLIVSFVLDVARSKFCQRRYFLIQFIHVWKKCYSLTHSSGVLLWLPTLLHFFLSLGMVIASL